MGSTPTHRYGSGADGAAVNLVYGTDINEAEVKKDFRLFIQNFRLGGEEQPHYLQELRRALERQVRKEQGIKFPVNGLHIFDFNSKLYNHLVTFPTEVIPIFDFELWDMSLKELEAEPENLAACQVKIYGLREKDSKVMRNMNPSDIEKLVALQGIVIRCSDLVPDMNKGTFRCTTEDARTKSRSSSTTGQLKSPHAAMDVVPATPSKLCTTIATFPTVKSFVCRKSQNLFPKERHHRASLCAATMIWLILSGRETEWR